MSERNNFTFDDPCDFTRLRDAFKKAGYTDKGVLDVVGVKDFPSMRETDVPLLLRRTNDGTPLSTLIRLFLIEVPCNVEAVADAVYPVKLEYLAQAGIILIKDASVTATVRILPYKDIFVAFDQPGMLRTESKKNYVMGLGSSTLTLADLTVRKQSRLTLDLGTGSGIHAFLAARHSDHVIAVDLNPRAVKFAEFNSRLNGLSNVECLQGDLFVPVGDKKFDLVITNPPFVISPETQYIYRDGGMEGDQITRKIVSQVPRYLNEGGYCQVLCNWAELKGVDWKERLRGWFEGAGCDAWVLRSDTINAETYAVTWIKHTEKAGTDFPQRLEKWMAYYETQGIVSMGSGLITMRRSSGRPNWFCADAAPDKMQGPCGEYIALGFELRDFLHTLRDDSMLLDMSFSISPGARLESQAKPSPEGWVDESVRLWMSQGFSYSGNIDYSVANMLIKCNGQRKLGDIMNEMAHSLQTDPEKIRPSLCSIVRGLVERGFLLPPGCN